jgi:UDP-N-acetylglucosamine 3-dehydrogenase
MKKLKVGVIGLGIFGEMETSILSQLPNVEIVALSTTLKSRVEEIGEKYKVNKLFTNHTDLLKEKDINAVFIVSAAKNHVNQALSAISRGKHVFIEKPAALSFEDTKNIINSAKEAGIVLMVGHERRFEVGNATIKKHLDMGNFGRLLYLVFRLNISKRYFEKDETYSHPVFETMSHDINLALWFAQSRVKRVYAREIYDFTDKRPDACLAILTFKSGVVSFFETNWLIPNGAPTNHWRYGGTMDAGYEVVGSRMTAKTNLINSGLLLWNGEKVLSPEKEWWPEAHEKIEGALRNEIIHFVDCALIGEESNIASNNDVLYEAMLIDTIIRSASEEREIVVDG